MLYRKPDEINREVSDTHSLIAKLTEEYEEKIRRLAYKKKLLNAELLLAIEYYKGQL